MKKIFLYTLITLIVCSLVNSCIDDSTGLLDKTESGDMTEERVFSNASYAGQFLTGIYTRIPMAWHRQVYLDAATDIGESRPWWGWVNRIHNGAWSSSSIPEEIYRWADYYAAIRACNKFLEKIDDVPADPEANGYGAIKDERIRKIRKAEAYALRAFFYTELFKCYGGVPIILKVLDIDSPELYTPRATPQQMVEQIVADCDRAIPDLPFRAAGDEYPRMTAMTTKAIKARALLLAASPLFNSDKDAFGNPFPADCPYGWGNYDRERWKRAADAAMDVITFTSDPTGQISGTYGLEVLSDPIAAATETDNSFTRVNSSYPGSPKAYGWFSVFVQNTSKEIFIATPYKGNTNELEKWQMPGRFDGGDRSYTMPTLNFAAMFETKEGYTIYQLDSDGNPVYDAAAREFKINPASGYDPQKPNNNRDNRYYHTFYFQGGRFQNRQIDCWYAYDGQKGPHWQIGYANTGLFLRKFLDPIKVSLNAQGLINGQTSHRYALMRYVEFLLAYAEAQNEYLDDGADRAMVIEQLNKIRARADMPNVETTFERNGWRTTDKVKMRQFIQRERTIELAFEDMRFYDIRRWKIGEKTQKTVYAQDVFLDKDGIIKYSVKVWEPRFFQPQHNLLPIPQSEINNIPGLVQNPGW